MRSRYRVCQETADCLCIEDLGPWDQHQTVTNDAENVVADLADKLNGRRLEYYDSEGRRDQLLVRHGRFAGFAPAGKAVKVS